MKTAAFKTSDYLKTQKQVVAYLNAALEDGDHAVLLEALRNVARSRGGNDHATASSPGASACDREVQSSLMRESRVFTQSPPADHWWSASNSNSALFRSSVSKPSVNQS